MPGMVSVGCKLPAGLLLRIFEMHDFDDPVMGGGTRTVQRSVPLDKTVKLNGSAKYVGQDVEHAIILGTGITSNVDADFMTKWMEQNRDTDIVKKGIVFVQQKPGDIEAQAREHRSVKTGLEGIDPENLPPEFKGRIRTEVRK